MTRGKKSQQVSGSNQNFPDRRASFQKGLTIVVSTPSPSSPRSTGAALEDSEQGREEQQTVGNANASAVQRDPTFSGLLQNTQRSIPSSSRGKSSIDAASSDSASQAVQSWESAGVLDGMQMDGMSVNGNDTTPMDASPGRYQLNLADDFFDLMEPMHGGRDMLGDGRPDLGLSAKTAVANEHGIVGTGLELSDAMNSDTSTGYPSLSNSSDFQSLPTGLFENQTTLVNSITSRVSSSDDSPGKILNMSDVDDIADDDCECTSTALQILERVAATISYASSLSGNDWSTSETKLDHLKGNLSQCFTLSSCFSCHQDSGFVMLILVIYEKLASSLEEVVHELKRHLDTLRRTAANKPHPSHKRSESRDISVQQGQTAGMLQGQLLQQRRPRMSLGRYQIDTAEEHSTVFATLILLQLSKLAKLVDEVKRNVVNSQWESHLILAKVLSKRMRILQGQLQ